MKKVILAVIAVLLSCSLSFAQDKTNAKLPNVTLKTIDGKSIKVSEFSNDGKPFAVCFWATWCKPCLTEMNTMAELYSEWQEETGIKIYAISIDDARTSSKVLPLVRSNGWEYEVVLDPNSELKRALGVNNPPHTFVINGNGEIVWQHVGYAPGDEAHLIEVIKKVAAGEEIEK